MAFSIIQRFLAPAPHIQRLPEEEVRRRYPWFRWRIMESTFIGYGSFYLVRNNFSVVTKDMQEALGYAPDALGHILAVSAVTYGLGKFVLGAVSDRSDPRKFMAVGLLLTALCNFAFGAISTFWMHLFLWSLNGFFQGMGWPPCGRSMGHWFSERERGLKFSIWNTSHNVGGGVAGVVAAWGTVRFGGWQYAFFVPGCLAMISAIYLFWRLRDTPQSVGLPPIEEYNNDYPEKGNRETAEKELTTRELLFDYVLTNRLVWLLAFANFFAYITRYSMLDWGPMYLRDVKGATITDGGWATAILNFGGIPSTILLGWVSDRLAGRRGMVAVLCLVPILAAFTTINLTPAGFLWLDMTMLFLIGFLIYPVINFIVIIALDLTSKKAIGTAAGFIGLFGYLGRYVQAEGSGWMLTRFTPTHGLETAWKMVIIAYFICTVMAIVLMAFTWKLKPRA
ncbi:MAG: MFS transporter [Phycisphaerae bacterium]|nr:MFS transporter [Phycisphaerae bacterium]